MPLKNAADYPSSGSHNVWRTKKKRKKKAKESKEASIHRLQWIRDSRKNQQAPLLLCHYYFSASVFFSKTPASDVSVSLSFQDQSWKQSRGCDWTLRAAPELYFEEETTEPQIMLYSPLVSTTVIRFSLCKILEKDCRSGFLQSKGHCTDVKLETGDGHETCVKSRRWLL